MIPEARPRAVTADETLIVVDARAETVEVSRMRELERFFRAGDALVLNDSATLPASIAGLVNGAPVELRLAHRDAASPDQFDAIVFGAGNYAERTEDRALPPPLAPGDRIESAGLTWRVLHVDPKSPRLVRLVGAPRDPKTSLLEAVFRAGAPIQYSYTKEPLATWDVQTAFASRAWSFEMPSATRPVRFRHVRALRERNVSVVALTHGAGLTSTGDAALDARLPFAEPYEITPEVVRAVARAREKGRRVVAAGTSVVRALEGSASAHGDVRAELAETDWLGRETTRLSVVSGILTGLHAPGESHYALLRAFASDALLRSALATAERVGCRSHEFGDAMLILC